jgi:hypothetical protein
VWVVSVGRNGDLEEDPSRAIDDKVVAKVNIFNRVLRNRYGFCYPIFIRYKAYISVGNGLRSLGCG